MYTPTSNYWVLKASDICLLHVIVNIQATNTSHRASNKDKSLWNKCLYTLHIS